METQKSWKPQLLSNVMILPKWRVLAKMPWFCVFLQEWFVFNQHSWSLLCDFNAKKNYSCICFQRPFVLLLSGSICLYDVIVKICILMLCSDKISQIEIFHCMYWWASMLYVEFYTLYNSLRACNLMPILCCDFAVIFAIFAKVRCVFCQFLPWFSTVLSLCVSAVYEPHVGQGCCIDMLLHDITPCMTLLSFEYLCIIGKEEEELGLFHCSRNPNINPEGSASTSSP